MSMSCDSSQLNDNNNIVCPIHHSQTKSTQPFVPVILQATINNPTPNVPTFPRYLHPPPPPLLHHSHFPLSELLCLLTGCYFNTSQPSPRGNSYATEFTLFLFLSFFLLLPLSMTIKLNYSTVHSTLYYFSPPGQKQFIVI